MKTKFIYMLVLAFFVQFGQAQVLRTKKISDGYRASGKVVSRAVKRKFRAGRDLTFQELEKTKKELKELKEKKDWSLGVYHEIGPLYDDEAGFETKDMSGYTLGILGYDAGWKYNPSFRVQMGNKLSSTNSEGEDQDMFTMYDPYLQFAGTTWSGGDTSLSNNFRVYAPLSEDSADDGLVTQLRLQTKIKQAIANDWSVYLSNWLIGSFFGFSSNDDGSYGTASFELGTSGPINDALSLGVSYTTKATRKDGQGLGFLDFTGGSETLTIWADLTSIDFISPTIYVYIPMDAEDDDSKYNIALGLYKSIF